MKEPRGVKTRQLARRGLVTQPKDCEEAARGRVW